MSVLHIISGGLSLFLASIVLLKRNKSTSDFLLFSWLLFTSLHMTVLYMLQYNAANGYPYPWLIGLEIPLIVVHSTWMYIYILSFVRPELLNYRILFHTLPFLALNMVMIRTFYTRSGAEKIASYQSALQGSGYIDRALELTVILVICISFAYLLAGFWVLRIHKKQLKNQYSNLHGVDLKWLSVLLYSITIVIAINTILEWLRNYLDRVPSQAAIYAGLVFVVAGIAYVGIHGIRQTSIMVDYGNYPVKSSRSGRSSKGEGPVSGEQVTREKLEEDYDRLVRYLDQEKPFLDVDLNLLALSGMLNMKPRYLSQLINRQAGKNFFDFINALRIEEFKTRIRNTDSQKYTLLSIAYECGFNSKATFNRVFKNHTGYTPSQFLHNPRLS